MTLDLPPEYEARLRAAATAAGYSQVEQFIIHELLSADQVRRPDGARQGGQWKGKVTIADDFDELPPDLRDAFGMTQENGTVD